MKSIFKYIKYIIINLIVFIILLEISCFILTKFKFLPINNEPTYNLKLVFNNYSGVYWRTENKDWGAWHKPNSSSRHLTKCFDITYEANDIGARDNKNYNSLINNTNTIVMGDSFAEGFGVELDNIFSKKLEKEKSKSVLNFASGGDFGPANQYILYNQLIKKFKHDEIIYFFLPANDFYDNSDRFINNFGIRHRPYYTKLKDTKKYDIIFKKNSKKTDTFDDFNHNNFTTYFKLFIKEFTYSSNLIRSFIHLNSTIEKKGVSNEVRSSSGYFATDKYSVNGAMYILNKLFSEISPQIKKTIIIIPSKFDIKKIEEKGKIYQDFHWYKAIKKIAINNNIRLLDLAVDKSNKLDFKRLNNGYKNWFLTCDGHWNKNGNKMALDLFLNN
jgi:hypothetical protein